ncbi:MAG: sigma-54 dependent transcriptional regulator, partial [Pseudomonas neustonica]
KTASAKPKVAAAPGDEYDMGIIGSCESMQTLFKRISKVAPTDSTVLIQGESGTGKELVARAMHERSQRAKAPLISVNCAAIPETLIESELFGHEKGSFTGATAGRTGLVEAADGGTLFLDEIGELPLEAQARLLRVLQEGEIRRVGSVQSHKVDVRLVAATHRDLKTMARQGLFREDLFYRLNVIELRLPPLRDRGKDVVLIAEALLERAASNTNQHGLHFSAEARNAILNYTWPGNVRELENAIERSAILCDHDEITADLLGIELDAEYERASEAANALQTMQHADSPGQEPAEDLSLEDYFQHFVLEHQEHMTETQLAHKLGISRKCLWERRQRLGIPRKKTANS